MNVQILYGRHILVCPIRFSSPIRNTALIIPVTCDIFFLLQANIGRPYFIWRKLTMWRLNICSPETCFPIITLLQPRHIPLREGKTLAHLVVCRLSEVLPRIWVHPQRMTPYMHCRSSVFLALWTWIYIVIKINCWAHDDFLYLAASTEELHNWSMQTCHFRA
jgi:hypothetical protein